MKKKLALAKMLIKDAVMFHGYYYGSHTDITVIDADTAIRWADEYRDINISYYDDAYHVNGSMGNLFFDYIIVTRNHGMFDTRDQYAKMAEWDSTYEEARMEELVNAIKDPIEESILLIKEWVKSVPGYHLASWKEGVYPFNGYGHEGYITYNDLIGAIRSDMNDIIYFDESRNFEFQDLLIGWNDEEGTMIATLVYITPDGVGEYHKEFYIKGECHI